MKVFWKNLSHGFIKIRTPAILLFVLAFALLFVWQRAYTMSLSRRIIRYENRLLELKACNSKKLIKIATLSSPERIEKLAHQMCNLRYASPNERVCLLHPKEKHIKKQTRLERSFVAIGDFFKRKWNDVICAAGQKNQDFYQGDL